ncbi:hypothetical protein M758_6G135700 [Ceratodon purpureus]|nr:hypothetical protein M758_6G135700 [Ceratodon purpureus]
MAIMASVVSLTAPPMVPSMAFGVSGSLKDGLEFLDELTYIYVASHCLVEKSLAEENSPTRFIAGNSSMCGISAIAVSLDKRNLAVAEIARQDASSATTSSPVINVYGSAKLFRRRSLTSVSAGTHEYVSLSFTCDGKRIAALGGPPEWQLQVWNIMQNKVVGSIKTVTLNSTAAYQMVDSALRQVSTEYTNQEGHKVFCHTWIPPPPEAAAEDEDKKDKDVERKNSEAKKGKKPSVADVVDCGCVYALDSGELLYVNNGEVIARIRMQSSGDEVCIAHTILPYSKGIICGESGKISFYEYDKAHKTYRRYRSVRVEETNARVCGLALSVAEDMLMCLLSTNRLVHLSFDELDEMSAETVSSACHTQSYHQTFITGMDTCLLKPFVVTCSKDNSVRVWDYERLSCEILKIFPSEALSVSMHPNGLHLLVGFLDCLYLFDMLISDLRLWREFSSVKGCTNCAFSRGGQYFAATSGNSVHIISTYTGHAIGHLRAHLNKVRSIWWANDDFNLVTAGMDGAIYEWDLKTCKRSREYVLKGCMQTSVIIANDSKLFLSTTTDCKLRELDNVEIFREPFINEDRGALLGRRQLKAM